MPVASRTRPTARTRKERVLVEFPLELLKRADRVAREREKNRSDLIRTAVEQLIDSIETKRFEEDLASAYQANAGLSSEVIKDFSHVEGF